MAICAWCDQEMSTAPSCTTTTFHRDGSPLTLAPYRSPRRASRAELTDRCGDCGVVDGGSHHPGCDMARCPVCRGQLMSCGCRFDEDGPETDDEGELW